MYNVNHEALLRFQPYKFACTIHDACIFTLYIIHDFNHIRIVTVYHDSDPGRHMTLEFCCQLDRIKQCHRCLVPAGIIISSNVLANHLP